MMRKIITSMVATMALVNIVFANKNNTLLQPSYTISGRSIVFPSEEDRLAYTESGRYNPKNILSTRMQFFKHRLFITQPRYKSGLPLTLGLVSTLPKSDILSVKPFPSWDMQEEGNCEALQSAVDLYIDLNNILWVLDTGSANAPQCSPKVVALSMITTKILKTIDLAEYTTDTSGLQYIVVENTIDGNSHIYISDMGSKSLILIDFNSGKGRKLILPGEVTEGCESNKALYLTMSQQGYHNFLYFTYLECEGIYSVSTLALKQETTNASVYLVATKQEPVVFCGTDGFNKLFYRYKQGSKIYIWDVDRPFPKDDEIQEVYEGKDGRIVTHISTGPWGLPWLMETNVKNYMEDCQDCDEPVTRILPITGIKE